jgi:hypothetical protein
MRFAGNRLAVEARLLANDGIMHEHVFILDTGAVISTISKFTAIKYGIYENIVNHKAFISGFNKIPMFGRVVYVSHLYIGSVGVRNTYFFVPDDDVDIIAVLGAAVLNGLVPIPDFKEKIIWIYKNQDVPAPYYSDNLGVSLFCEILVQDEERKD